MALEDNAVDVLIFSRDRAAQLDLLLRSIERHTSEVYSTITVLWLASDDGFGAGYRKLIREHREIYWWEQQEVEGLETYVRTWLDDPGETVSFLVDDDVFYRDAAPPPELPWSYRGGDYWYPFSLDGNVYPKAWVTALLDGLTFRDPTELEGAGHSKALTRWPELRHGEPCLVGIPANRVSQSSGMPHMGVPVEELNRRFLGGERLELDGEPTGVYPHEPIPYRWALRYATSDA